MELGRSWRTLLLMMLLLRPRGAGEPPGHRQQAALKDQRFRGRVPPLYPMTRAREVDSATCWGRHMAAAADSIFLEKFGSGPRRSLRRSAERPARAAWAALRLLADVAIGATMELGRSWRTLLLMMLLLRPRGAGEPRGHRQQAALKDQRFRGRVPPLYPMTRAREVDSATCWGRHMAAAADSIFLEKFGSGPRRSLRRSAERPARAAWAALRLLADVAIGATMELGRSWRTLLLMMLLLRPRGAGEPPGHRQQAALKDQRFRGRVPPLYPMTRAREVDSATCWGRHLAAAADSIFLEKFGSGPRRSLRRSAERPARAAWAALRLLADVAIGATMELGRSWRTLLLMMLLLRPRGAGEPPGHRQQGALKDQRFRGRVPPLYPMTCAREVDSATCWGRHLAAAADSIFLEKFGSGPRRSLRRSAERPARAAWAALRLLADVAIGATMELGRSWRTLLLMMLLLRPRGAGEPPGHRQQGALKDQRFRGRVPPLYPMTRAREVDSATCWGRHLAAAADSIFLEKFGSGPRRSLRRSAERPARAAWAALRLLADVAIGATMELGRSWRTLLLMMLLLRPRGAGEPPGHRQQGALKDQRFRGRVPPLYPMTRAREVDSATCWGRHKQ